MLIVVEKGNRIRLPDMIVDYLKLKPGVELWLGDGCEMAYIVPVDDSLKKEIFR